MDKKNIQRNKKIRIIPVKSVPGFFAILFFIMFFGEKFFGGKGRFSPGPANPLKWDEAIEKIPIYLISSLVFTIIGSILDSNLKKKRKDKYVCDKCNSYKTYEKEDICACGGSFVDEDYMKWIDNGDNPSSPVV